jgi:protein-S-isoprenylcysteine O-methyltransferase Ste14
MEISKYQKLFGVGPLGLGISLVLLGFLWLLDRALGQVQIMNQPRPVRVLGLILIALEFCWHAWCIRTIRGWWKENRLCTTGPYRIVRHPIYAGGVLLGLGGVSLLFNSWVVLFAPVAAFVVDSVLVQKEEAMMATIFGEEYKRYAARTGRLFPRLTILSTIR